MEMELIARFHVGPGSETLAEHALREVAIATLEEPGCLEFRVLRANGDPNLFFVHSLWRNEHAFDLHVELAHTRAFLETMESIVTGTPEIRRTHRIV